MTSTKTGDSAVLNLGEIGEEGLTFGSTTHNFESQVPDSALDEQDEEGDDDKAGLLGGQEAKRPTSYNLLSMSFYGQFFDVDTEDVRRRLAWSVTPRPSGTSDFVRKSIRPNPDLYGPFWVCVTLIFSVAISGNVASYLQAALTAKDDSVRGFRWHYDFHKVTLAATAVFGYACLVPAALYTLMWSQAGKAGSGTSASMTELLCIYGYSLSIFIPVSVLWTIQNATLQWTLVVVATAISGTVLVLALWNNVIKESVRKNLAMVTIAIVVLLHLLLALGFMLYFFHVPSTALATPGLSGSSASPGVPPVVPNKPPGVKQEDAGEVIPANKEDVKDAKDANPPKSQDEQKVIKEDKDIEKGKESPPKKQSTDQDKKEEKQS